MSDLIIYGASDDLIEAEGAFRDEFNPPYGKPATVVVKVDDAVYATVVIDYDHDGDGEWRILDVSSTGDLARVDRARGEDEGNDEHGCPGYSDKAVITMDGIESRRIDISLQEA